jgi:hypothetical protein
MSKKKKVPETPIVDHDPPRTAAPAWIMAIGATVLVVAVFAGVTALLQRRTSEPLHLPPQQVKPAAAKPTPAPWTYDSVTNQHWDPNHNHWHKGHPPNQGHAGEAPESAPDIPNPTAWQYDAASNQHFNPDHNHWHSGPPPADKVGTAPVADAPAPPVSAEAASVPTTEPVAIEDAVEVPVEDVGTEELPTQ